MSKAWSFQQFRDVCELIKGKQPTLQPIQKRGYQPYLVVKYLRGGHEPQFASSSDKNAVLVRPDEIMIICDGSNSGETFTGHTGILASTMAKVTHSDDLDARFLQFYLQSLFEKFNAAKTGAAIPHLDLGALKKAMLPVPSLREQRRIVGILDKALAAIQLSIGNAERMCANARELYDAELHAALLECAGDAKRVTLATLLERGWVESHLDGNHGSEYPRKHEFIASGVPYISANCVKNGSIDFSLAKHLSAARAKRIRKGVAQDRDVLFAHNATVGPVAILSTTVPQVILGTSLTYYRCNSRFILPEYLAAYMRSSEFRRQYTQVMRQSTRNQVPITKQREFFHVIPTLREQARIVKRVDSLHPQTHKLEENGRATLIALEQCKRSLLNAAFHGDL